MKNIAEGSQFKFNPGINHRKWQALLIPLMAFIACLFLFYGSQSETDHPHFPWRTFVTIIVFTFGIWQANLVMYRWLDVRMAFYESPAKRMLIQLLACIAATWITFTGLYALLSLLFTGGLRQFFSSAFFLFLLVATGISLAINSLYIIRYLQSTVLYKEAISTQKMNEVLSALEQVQRAEFKNVTPVVEEANQPVIPASTNSMVVETGSKLLNIAFAEMAYWYSSGKLVTLVTKEDKKIATNFTSYTSLLTQLPSELFFQLNRQYVTHIKSIIAITDDANGKLLVELSAGKNSSKKEMVSVSRYRSRELKTWFAKNAVI